MHSNQMIQSIVLKYKTKKNNIRALEKVEETHFLMLIWDYLRIKIFGKNWYVSLDEVEPLWNPIFV